MPSFKSAVLCFFLILLVGLFAETSIDPSASVGDRYKVYDSLKIDPTSSILQSYLLGFGVGLNSIGDKAQFPSAVFVDSLGFVLLLGGGAWLAADSKYSAGIAGSLMGVGFIVSTFSRIIQGIACGNFSNKHNRKLKERLGIIEVVDLKIGADFLVCSVSARF